MTILVKKVFISSKPTFVCLLCPPLCGPFSIQESAAGGLSYKAKKMPRWFPNETSKTILSHTTSHHASEDLFYKIRLVFSRTLKLIICSFRMNNQHFNFWSSNDIYHVNFLLICFTQSKFLSARIQNPYHRNLLIESFP